MSLGVRQSLASFRPLREEAGCLTFRWSMPRKTWRRMSKTRFRKQDHRNDQQSKENNAEERGGKSSVLTEQGSQFLEG